MHCTWKTLDLFVSGMHRLVQGVVSDPLSAVFSCKRRTKKGSSARKTVSRAPLGTVRTAEEVHVCLLKTSPVRRFAHRWRPQSCFLHPETCIWDTVFVQAACTRSARIRAETLHRVQSSCTKVDISCITWQCLLFSALVTAGTAPDQDTCPMDSHPSNLHYPTLPAPSRPLHAYHSCYPKRQHHSVTPLRPNVRRPRPSDEWKLVSIVSKHASSTSSYWYTCNFVGGW